MADLLLDGATLVYRTPYHPALVAALKAAIPAVDRRWDPARKVWLVASSHGQALADITRQYLGEDVQVPMPTGGPVPLETRFLDVRYIGTTKDRGDGGDRTAFAWVGGEWAVVFPEKVLRQWFGEEDLAPTGQAAAPKAPADTTLYAVLGIARGADADAVRKAYRRMARQWHPDVCRELGAHEMFIRVQRAYEVLGDAGKRARYDAGLALAAVAEEEERRKREFADQLAARWAPSEDAVIGYRSPLRCGYLLAEGHAQLGRFIVEKVLAWEDIVDGAGQTLVASWPMGADRPEERWV